MDGGDVVIYFKHTTRGLGEAKSQADTDHDQMDPGSLIKRPMQLCQRLAR